MTFGITPLSKMTNNDTRHNDSQHNGIWHHDTQHNDSGHNDSQRNNKNMIPSIISITTLSIAYQYAQCRYTDL